MDNALQNPTFPPPCGVDQKPFIVIIFCQETHITATHKVWNRKQISTKNMVKQDVQIGQEILMYIIVCTHAEKAVVFVVFLFPNNKEEQVVVSSP